MLKKTQIAVEYLLVFTFILSVLVGFVVFSFNNSNSNKQEIVFQQLNKISQEIVSNAEIVFFMGYPSKITIQEIFPDSIHNITVINDWSNKTALLLFNTSYGEMVYSSKVNLNLSFPIRNISGKMIKIYPFSKGKRKITLIANTTYVKPHVIVYIH